jgi:hypothetical protein
MDNYNDENMRLITYYLCKNESKYYFPGQLKEELGLDIEDKKLRRELDILNKYDLIEKKGGQYGGVFDRDPNRIGSTGANNAYLKESSSEP